jgi:hypothetical protein
LFDDFHLWPQAYRTIGPKEVTLAPGKNIMQFETDVPPEMPGNGDPQKVTFLMRGLKAARFTRDTGFAK